MENGRIIKSLSGFYTVATNEGVVICQGRGVFRKRQVSLVVGDLVTFSGNTITAVKERKNFLIRPPVANIDQAILVFSAIEPDFAPKLLDRFLVLVESKNILPLICITKVDKLTNKKREALKSECLPYIKMGYDVQFISSKTHEGISFIKNILDGRTSVLAGQSGVGKTSLINALHKDLNLKTGEISHHLGRGRHTTRHVELIAAEKGFIVDTPGFSSLDLDDIKTDELSHYFVEFKSYSKKCKFRGCLHIQEPHCEVRNAVERNEISEKRYKNYLQFMQGINERKPRY